MPIASLDEIRSKVGQEVGVSAWLSVDQARIDAFADATEDHQFIHVDPEAAAAAGFGGTIAHGFLSLSLLSRMAADAMLIPEGVRMAVNYGLDRVRFLAPVKSGKRVRGRFILDFPRRESAGAIAVSSYRHGRDRRRGKARAYRPVAWPDIRPRRVKWLATPSSFPPPGPASAGLIAGRSTQLRRRRWPRIRSAPRSSAPRSIRPRSTT